jgi:hypothetical protein
MSIVSRAALRFVSSDGIFTVFVPGEAEAMSLRFLWLGLSVRIVRDRVCTGKVGGNVGKSRYGCQTKSTSNNNKM